MKRYSLFILILLLRITAVAQQQVTISGVVYATHTQKPVEGVSVIIQDVLRHTVYGYQITRNDGVFSISCKSEADSLLIVVKGFNIKEQFQKIACRPQHINFIAEFERIKVKEVVVKAPAVIRRSDTLSYMVSKYMDATDHTIGDVLEKMPGIHVSQSGKISYNGQEINKFYIEDLDVLEGRYGIATNNIQAKDIAKVEVYENHQPIKALQKTVPTDQAAINLRLKESAKGAWNATLQAGAGYKPWIWDIQSTAIYFGRHFQTINTYKTNNSGDDVERELISFYENREDASSLSGIHLPITPSLDKKRYIDNNVHTVSINTITKLKKELELKANAHYIHNFLNSAGTSISTYYLSGHSPLVVSEQIDARQRTDQTEISLQLHSNTQKHYLEEKLSFSGRWDSDYGQVLNDNEEVNQYFHLPQIALHNHFQNVRRSDKWTLYVNSETDYNHQPSTLLIRPMLYPEVFHSPANYPDAQQTLNIRSFRTQNQASASYSVKRWSYFLTTGFYAEAEKMRTKLSPMNPARQIYSTSDSMRNDIYRTEFNFMAGPGVRYAGNKFKAEVSVPAAFMNLYTEDKIRKKNDKNTNLFLYPSVWIETALTVNLKFSVRASYSEKAGGLYDTYRGFIMTDYRMISSKEGLISLNRDQNYSAAFSYGNAIRALFASAEVRYWHTHYNLMYGTTYEGSLSRIKAKAINHHSDGFSVSGKISKHLDGLSTTVNASGGFRRSWAETLRQEQFLQTVYDVAIAGFGFSGRFIPNIPIDYNIEYSRNRSRIEGSKWFDPINAIRQRATVNFIIRKNFTGRIGGDHYYNAAIGGKDRNMFFADAGIEYKSRHIIYSIEARNLLNTTTFHSTVYNDITNYVYSYKLRPASVLFKVKFSLR